MKCSLCTSPWSDQSLPALRQVHVYAQRQYVFGLALRDCSMPFLCWTAGVPAWCRMLQDARVALFTLKAWN